MDTLDDFTVMNIIAMCDVKTVFGVIPLICRRMYELHDDAAVVRHFRDDIQAQIIAPVYISPQAWISTYDCLMSVVQQLCARLRPKLPLGVIVRADLGDFALVIDMTISGLNKRSLHRRQIFMPNMQQKFMACEGEYAMIYKMPCGLAATFETLCATLDAHVLNDMLTPAASVTYTMRNVGYTQSVNYDRDQHGEQTMYALGFGHKYTALAVTVYVNADLYV